VDAEEAGSFENTAGWRGIRLFFGGDGAYIIKKQGGRRMRRGRLGKECGTLDPISDRVLMLAVYIADTGATVRDAAKRFGVSKSTVHKDMTERLMNIDRRLYARVRRVLDRNREQRHIRGGMATKEKYQGMRSRSKEV